MTAEEYAKEFVNEFLEELPETDLKKTGWLFNSNVLRDDPELKVLNKELNKIGYTIYFSTIENGYKIKKI